MHDSYTIRSDNYPGMAIIIYIPALHVHSNVVFAYTVLFIKQACTDTKLSRDSISVTMTRISSGLVVIVILLDTVSLSHEVALQLNMDPVAVNCIGGGIGLTNTSVLVEYRIVDTTSSPASVGEWRFLAADIVTNLIAIERNESQIHHSAADGFQLRLLQLEHGGGQCNCWKLNSISVDCGGDMTDTSTAMCSQQGLYNIIGSDKMLLCLDYASRARGLITEVYCSVSNNSEPCPGDSDTLLPSGGPALPSHCETSDFRM